MTQDELMNLSDEELNELSAVKVMGWENSASKLFWNERFTPHQSLFVKEIKDWNPTNDMNDCFKLLNTALENVNIPTQQSLCLRMWLYCIDTQKN